MFHSIHGIGKNHGTELKQEEWWDFMGNNDAMMGILTVDSFFVVMDLELGNLMSLRAEHE